MQVLEKSQPKNQWTETVTCTGVPNVRQGCGAKLIINEDDLFRIEIGNAGFQHYIAQFQCPECGVRTDFDDYPNASILQDYWQHASFRDESDLKGYEQERWSWKGKKFKAV
jgi:hypothetical protein